MRTQTGALLLLLLLLLAGCFSSAVAQGDGGGRQNIWNDPITFRTKGLDLCTMTVTGQGEHTRLRVACRGSARSYWCEYLGTPDTCPSYSRNPRHYFTQVMWGLRKLANACQGPRQIKPQMCKRATDDAQMVFATASFSPPSSPPRASSGTGARAAAQLARLRAPGQARGPSAKSVRLPPAARTTPRSSPSPPMPTTTTMTTTPPTESRAEEVARQYCWRSLRGVCAYVIGLVGK